MFLFPLGSLFDAEFVYGLTGSAGWEGLQPTLCSNSLLLHQVIPPTIAPADGVFQSPPGHGQGKMPYARLIISWSGGSWKIAFLVLDTILALVSETAAKPFLSFADGFSSKFKPTFNAFCVLGERLAIHKQSHMQNGVYAPEGHISPHLDKPTFVSSSSVAVM